MRNLIYFLFLAFLIAAVISCDQGPKEEPPQEEQPTEQPPVEEETQEETTQKPIDLGPFEKYCKEYFSAKRNVENVSDMIIRRTRAFISINKGTKEFAGKTPYRLVPVYAYGVKGVAYYEVWMTQDGKNPVGWYLLSRTDQDYPLVNFSHEGQPYSKKLMEEAEKKGIAVNDQFKIYRFGMSYFTLENEAGEKVAEYGKMPHFLTIQNNKSNGGKGDSETKEQSSKKPEDQEELREGKDFYPVENYEDLKKYFPRTYFHRNRAKNAKDMLQRIFPENEEGEIFRFQQENRDYYIYRWVSGTQCLYTQIPANSSYNHTGCWSGCNNNAWASLYGWWDLNQGKNNLIATTSTSVDCPTDRSNMAARDVVDPVQMWFRGTCDTYCSGGGGWTKWKNAWKGYKWANNEGYGYSYWYQWCNSDGCDADLANILVDCIGNNYRPAHIGANSHFYVGTGLAQWNTNTDWTWVYSYPGWATNHDDDVWIYWRDLNASTKLFVY